MAIVDLELTDDQELFRETTRRALDERSPLTRVRELIDDPLGFDPSLWRQGGELGWYAMLVPEQHGGGSVSGQGLLDAAIVAEELGRMVHPGPFHSTNVVAHALTQFGTAEQREKYLPAIASGELIATWAFAEPDQDWKAETVALAAVASDDGYVLDGVKTYVPYAHAADLILVTARTAEGLAQFLVPSDAPGVSVEMLESLDVARRFSVVRFEGVMVGAESVVGDPGESGSGAGPGAGLAVERQLQVALVLQCAETNGATDAGFGLTVQYCKDRVAFGRPIGSYQALKHRMADHRMWLEGSHAATAYAAHAVQEGRPDSAIAARVAKAQVGKWSSVILHDCVQLHGGIAMTWDYDLHLYFRRAISNEVTYGSPYEQHRALVDIAEGVGEKGQVA
jgi:alkylation response protein AidB-like acyl-CoA dehydrogenase